MAMITQIDDYFAKGCGRCPRFDTPQCSAVRWGEGMAHLRRICLAAGLIETVKWGHPCYIMGDRNVAILGAFVERFCLNFVDAALMKDPDGLLERAGPNSTRPSRMCFTDAADVLAHEVTIVAYLQEAIGYVKGGIKPPKTQIKFELPDELQQCLDQDPEMAEAFHALTPGRQRSYVIHLTTTKNPTTRFARIAKFREKVLAGKGATET